MKIVVLSLMMLTACRRDWQWRGVEGPLKCADSNTEEVHCIGGSRVYLGIRDVDSATMDCALMPSAMVRPC